MFEPEMLTRRGFLQAAASAAWLAAGWPAIVAAAEQAAAARDAGTPLETLTPDEAADLAAIAAQIFPTDALPGATEAGVVYFMDSALRTFMAGAREPVLAGLQDLNARAAAMQAGARFAQLPGAEQTRLLLAQEATPFFGTVRFMTIAGMFALPVYGGNRGHAGWKVLGFEHRHFWQPPFGFYDAAASAPRKK